MNRYRQIVIRASIEAALWSAATWCTVVVDVNRGPRCLLTLWLEQDVNSGTDYNEYD